VAALAFLVNSPGKENFGFFFLDFSSYIQC
jgi:hypothetical protein